MTLLLTAAIGFTAWAEQSATPQLAQDRADISCGRSGLLAQARGQYGRQRSALRHNQ